MAVTADKVVVELELKDGQYLAKVKQAERQFTQSQDKIADAAKNTERQISASSAAIASSLRNMAGAIAAGASVSAIIKMGDAYTNFQNRLKAAGLSGQELIRVQGELYAAANRNGIAVDAVAALYQRASLAQKQLGASNQEIIDLTNGVSAALRVQGVSAEQASGPLLQLGQALGAGTVRAEELNSLLEGTPLIIQAAANGSDKFKGNMNDLAAAIRNGEVSSREFFDALQRGLPDIQKQAESLPKTVGQAIQILNNELGRYVGQTDQSLSATQRLAAGIEMLANNLDRVVPAVGALAAFMGVRLVGSLALAAASTTSKAYADALGAKNAALHAAAVNAQAAANARLVASGGAATASLKVQTAATLGAAGAARSAGAALLSMAGGPVTLGITALTLGIGYLVNENYKAEKAFDDLEAAVNDSAKEYEKAAAAAKALKDETGRLPSSQDAAAVSAAALTGEVSKLADQHYRAAAAAKAQAVEVLRLKAITAAEQTSQAVTQFRNLQRQAEFRETRRDPASRARVNQQLLQTREFQVMQTAANNARRSTAQLREELERPLSAYLPERGGGGGGNGTVTGAGRAARAATEATDTLKRQADEAMAAFERIEESLLTDAQRAAKQLAEEARVISELLDSGAISASRARSAEAGIYARDIQPFQYNPVEELDPNKNKGVNDYTKDWNDRQEAVAADMARTFVDVVASGNIGEAIGDEFKRAAFNGLEIIMKQLLMAALPKDAMGGFIGQIFGFGGNRAGGGMVKAGSAYTVGENGRETFVPSQNGYIIPNMKNLKTDAGQPSVVKLIVDEGSMFALRVQQISGPIAVQAASTSAAYSQNTMRTQRRRQSQSFV